MTPDLGETPPRPGRPPLPRVELKAAYSQAVLGAGGLPWILAPTDDSVVLEQYAAVSAGLLVSGGAFDIDPSLYGETARAGLGPTKPARTLFERLLLSRMLALGKPVFGICGGMQLLNVVLGGTLFQDVATEVPGALLHEQTTDTREPSHVVDLLSDSKLSAMTGASTIRANSTHHQAVNSLGRGLIASGRTSDGVVEAIELPGAPFVIGVQWHPELLSDPAQAAIYRAFVLASK